MSADSNPIPVPVVCAIIERDGRVLLAQRPPHKHLGGKWEFPGGKVEAGESPTDAIIREIREELGCEFIPHSELSPNVHHYETKTIELRPHIGTLSPNSNEPQTHEHTALAWVLPSELAHYDLAPADRPIAAAYQHHLRIQS